MQELRGNIRVYVRIKPLTADEVAAGVSPVLRCTADSSRIECLSANSTKAFDFDHVFGPKSNQGQVFSEVAGLITSVLDGCALMHAAAPRAPVATRGITLHVLQVQRVRVCVRPDR